MVIHARENNGPTVIITPVRTVDIDILFYGERVISAELNLDDLRTYRKEFPALPDMRQDCETLLR